MVYISGGNTCLTEQTKGQLLSADSGCKEKYDKGLRRQRSILNAVPVEAAHGVLRGRV